MEMIVKWRDARVERPARWSVELLVVTADGYLTTGYVAPLSEPWEVAGSEVRWWLPLEEIIQLPGVNLHEWLNKYGIYKMKEDIKDGKS